MLKRITHSKLTNLAVASKIYSPQTKGPLASSKDKGQLHTAAKKEERRGNKEEERNGAGMWRRIYTECLLEAFI